METTLIVGALGLQTRGPPFFILRISDFALLAYPVHRRIDGTLLVGGGLPFWNLGRDDCRCLFRLRELPEIRQGAR